MRRAAAAVYAAQIGVSLVLLPAEANAADPQVAVREHMACVVSNAAALDDQRMDAKKLAQLLIPRCHKEHEAAMLAIAPDQWKATPADEARSIELDDTLAALMMYRGQVQKGRK